MLITHAIFINIFTQLYSIRNGSWPPWVRYFPWDRLIIIKHLINTRRLISDWSEQHIWPQQATFQSHIKHFSTLNGYGVTARAILCTPGEFSYIYGGKHERKFAFMLYRYAVEVWLCITHPHGCGYPGQKAWHTCVNTRLFGHGTAGAPAHHPKQTIAAGLRQDICSYERTTTVPLTSHERQYLISLHYSTQPYHAH